VELQKLTGRQSKYTAQINRLSPCKGTEPVPNSQNSETVSLEEGSPSSTQIPAETEHQSSFSTPVPTLRFLQCRTCDGERDVFR